MTAAAPTHPVLKIGWEWIGVAGIAVLYVCSTLPTPLYPLYERQFGFSELIVTAVYASYVIGNLACSSPECSTASPPASERAR